MNEGMEYQAAGAQVAPLMEKVGKFVTDMAELGIEHSVTVSVRKANGVIAESAEGAESAEKSIDNYLSQRALSQILHTGPVLEIRPAEGVFVTSLDGVRRQVVGSFGDGNEGFAWANGASTGVAPVLAENTPDPSEGAVSLAKDVQMQPGETLLGVIEEPSAPVVVANGKVDAPVVKRKMPGRKPLAGAPKVAAPTSEAEEETPNPSTPAVESREKQTSPAFKITLRNISAEDRETVSGLYRGDMSFRSLPKEQRKRLYLAAMYELFQRQGAFTQAEFDSAKPGWMSAGSYIAQLLTIPWSGLSVRLAASPSGTMEMWKE